MTVAPVVVNPLIDSNTASVTLKFNWSDSASGTLPALPSTNQNKTVMTKPSRIRKSFFWRLAGNQLKRPAPNTNKAAAPNKGSWPSSKTRLIPMGGSMVKLNSISNKPRIRRVGPKCIITGMSEQLRTGAQYR